MKNAEKIKTFEDACAALKLDATKVIPDFSAYPEEDREAMIAHAKLVIIAKAINGDWKPDWSNWSQRKYCPWFDMEKSSSVGGFSYGGYGYGNANTYVGSRLCFENEENAKHAGTQFKDLYEAYFVIKA